MERRVTFFSEDDIEAVDMEIETLRLARKAADERERERLLKPASDEWTRQPTAEWVQNEHV
jgi:hypothetical protein